MDFWKEEKKNNISFHFSNTNKKTFSAAVVDMCACVDFI